jgi:hypothetical protein
MAAASANECSAAHGLVETAGKYTIRLEAAGMVTNTGVIFGNTAAVRIDDGAVASASEIGSAREKEGMQPEAYPCTNATRHRIYSPASLICRPIPDNRDRIHDVAGSDADAAPQYMSTCQSGNATGGGNITRS